MSHASLPEIPGYRLQAPLGRGAFGVVYAALDEQVGRRVAIKILIRGNHPDQVARFRREREAMARIDHPHVIRVHASGSSGGRPYVVLELLPGRTLGDRLRDPFTQQEGLEWVLQAALGLGALHAQGLVHRDVKPENLLLDGEGRVKVADLGLVGGLDFHSLTNEGTLLGSPGYFAPEVCAGERTRAPASDVYSLGVILFEVLTGQRPHPAGSLPALIIRRQEDPNPDPRRLASGVSGELAAVCLRATAGDPSQRFPSANEFAAALRTARDAAPASRSARWVAGILVLGILILVAGILGRHFFEPGRPSASPRASARASVAQPRVSATQREPTSSPSPLPPAFRVVQSLISTPGQLGAQGLNVAVIGTRVLTLERFRRATTRNEAPRSEALGSGGGCLREWTAAGEPLRSLALPQAVSLAVGPSGQRLAIAELDQVRLLDADSWRSLATLSWQGGHARVAFSPSGRRLAICGNGKVVVWEPVGGRVVAELPAQGLVIAFRGEDQILKRSGGSLDGGLELWNLKPPRLEREIASKSASFTDVAVDSRGWIYATQWSPPALLLWDGAGALQSSTPLPAEPTRLVISESAVVVAAQAHLCRLELSNLTARHVKTGERYLFDVAQGSGRVYGVGYGQRLLIAEEDLSPARPRSGWGSVRSLVTLSSGEWLLGTSSGLIRLVPNALPIQIVRPPSPEDRTEIWAHDDSSPIALTGGARVLNRVNILDGSSVQLPALPRLLRVVAQNSSGSRVLAGVTPSEWGPLLLLEDERWVPLGDPKAPLVTALTLSPQGGRGWVGRVDGSVEEWDLSTRRRAWVWPDPARSAVLRILRHGEGFFAACADGRLRRVTSTGREATAIDAHQGPVLDLCLLSDRVLSVGADGALRGWSLESGAPLAPSWATPPDDTPAPLSVVPGGRGVSVATLRGHIYELAWD